jgi:hypothetical protein
MKTETYQQLFVNFTNIKFNQNLFAVLAFSCVWMDGAALTDLQSRNANAPKN